MLRLLVTKIFIKLCKSDQKSETVTHILWRHSFLPRKGIDYVHRGLLPSVKIDRVFFIIILIQSMFLYNHYYEIEYAGNSMPVQNFCIVIH